MEIFNQVEDIKVIGVQVKDFPKGVKEAFGSLMNNFGASRNYYGVSWMEENNSVAYYAMAEEISPEEEEKYGYESFVIEQGDYETEKIHNWQSKPDCIKDVFRGLMGNDTPKQSRPCIEWYQSVEEMLCMIRAV